MKAPVITQADKEAAAKVMGWTDYEEANEHAHPAVLQRMVEAFARHRLAQPPAPRG